MGVKPNSSSGQSANERFVDDSVSSRSLACRRGKNVKTDTTNNVHIFRELQTDR